MDGVRRHGRGWYLGGDGVWRAYDGLTETPLCEMVLDPSVMGAETVNRMHALMAEHPQLRLTG
jgi:hypothetical protein